MGRELTKDLSIEELASLHLAGGRIYRERSRAVESWKYSKPADHNVKFGKREGGEVDRQSDKERADSLLIEWYRWTKLYRPNLGAPKIAPYCKQSTSSKQYEDPSDLIHDRVYRTEMEAVEFCVDCLDLGMRQSIGVEMKNREVSARVWRSPSNVPFSEALTAIVPIMRKKGLFD